MNPSFLTKKLKFHFRPTQFFKILPFQAMENLLHFRELRQNGEIPQNFIPELIEFYALRACQTDDLPLIREMVAVDWIAPELNRILRANKLQGFEVACQFNSFQVLEFITLTKSPIKLSLSDINRNEGKGFIKATENGHVDILDFLSNELKIHQLPSCDRSFVGQAFKDVCAKATHRTKNYEMVEFFLDPTFEIVRDLPVPRPAPRARANARIQERTLTEPFHFQDTFWTCLSDAFRYSDETLIATLLAPQFRAAQDLIPHEFLQSVPKISELLSQCLWLTNYELLERFFVSETSMIRIDFAAFEPNDKIKILSHLMNRKIFNWVWDQFQIKKEEKCDVSAIVNAFHYINTCSVDDDSISSFVKIIETFKFDKFTLENQNSIAYSWNYGVKNWDTKIVEFIRQKCGITSLK